MDARTPPDINTGRLTLSLSKYVHVMGILNVTPDSFSDGGAFLDCDKAVLHGLEMARLGAHIIDVGGESTRPGAKPLSESAEIDRVIPVIEALRNKIALPISIDTRKAKVADLALKAGAQIVNDISGLGDDNMAEVVRRNDAAVILMHMKGTPETMQLEASYSDVVTEVIDSLKNSVARAKAVSIQDSSIIIDPGIGFGKTLQHNLIILHRLEEFRALGYPICIGVSRKTFIGKVLNRANPLDRTAGSLAAGIYAAMKGASILRVHDVKETAEAVFTIQAISQERP